MARRHSPELTCGNIFIRPNYLEAVGDKIDGHQHNFDHTTIVFVGSVHVRAGHRFKTWRCPVCDKHWETRAASVDACPGCGNIVGIILHDQRFVLTAEGDFTAPAHFLVRADTDHEIVALAPDTELWCVYSHRTPQGEISQVATGWDKAYG